MAEAGGVAGGGVAEAAGVAGDGGVVVGTGVGVREAEGGEAVGSAAGASVGEGVATAVLAPGNLTPGAGFGLFPRSGTEAGEGLASPPGSPPTGPAANGVAVLAALAVGMGQVSFAREMGGK